VPPVPTLSQLEPVTRAIIGYIIINDKLKSNIEDTRVFRGSEIDSDHKLVESKFKFNINMKHCHKVRDKTIHKKPVGFKVHFLEEESIRTLYMNRVKVKLTPTTGNVDTYWLKIKQAILEEAEESTQYKKKKNQKWLRTWNDEIKLATEEKKASFQKYLQNKTVEHFTEYKKQRAIVRTMTQKQRGDWEKFVKSLERDITGMQQRRGFKIFKQLQFQERDKIKINPISKAEWKEYYDKLWNEQCNNTEEGTEKKIRKEKSNENTDIITMKELDEALKHVKNRKSPGLDNLPMELFKFVGKDLKVHTLHLCNNIADKNQIPQEWETGIIINIDKKASKSKHENYRGITPSIAYELFTNIIQNEVNAHVEEEMEEEQCGFRKGHSCVDAIFTAQHIIEKRKEHNLPLFLLFVDYEKAYNNVNRDMLWKIMQEKIPSSLLKIIKCIYRNTKLSIKLMMILYQNQFK
jgi:hypothetical protein